MSIWHPSNLDCIRVFLYFLTVYSTPLYVLELLSYICKYATPSWCRAFVDLNFRQLSWSGCLTMFKQGTLDRNGDWIVSRKFEEENGVCLKVFRASYVLGICKVDRQKLSVAVAMNQIYISVQFYPSSLVQI